MPLWDWWAQKDPAISHYIYEAFDYMSRPASEQSLETLLGLALKCGEVNLRAMEILNQGHCASFGTPEPTKVPALPAYPTPPLVKLCLRSSAKPAHAPAHRRQMALCFPERHWTQCLVLVKVRACFPLPAGPYCSVARL